jgi:hypothetical protein
MPFRIPRQIDPRRLSADQNKWLWRLTAGERRIKRMPQCMKRVTRGLFFLFSLVVLGMMNGATFPAQTARQKLSWQVRAVQSRMEGSRRAQDRSANAKSKDPYSDIDPSEFDMRLIVPHAPLCWSHAQAENPQRSQDNGEAADSAGRGALKGADPLLGPTAGASRARTRMKPCRGTPGGSQPNGRTRGWSAGQPAEGR